MSYLFAALTGLPPDSVEAIDAYSKATVTTSRIDKLDDALLKKWSVVHMDQNVEAKIESSITTAKLASKRRHDIAHGVVKNFGLRGNFISEKLDADGFPFSGGLIYALVPAGYNNRYLNPELGGPICAYSEAAIMTIAKRFEELTAGSRSLIQEIRARAKHAGKN